MYKLLKTSKREEQVWKKKNTTLKWYMFKDWTKYGQTKEIRQNYTENLWTEE